MPHAESDADIVIGGHAAGRAGLSSKPTAMTWWSRTAPCAATDLAGRLDGQERSAVRAGRGLHVGAGRGRDRGPGDRAGDPDSLRWHRYAKIFTPERTSEIQRMIIGRAVTGLNVR
jgi:hypothetical protein